MFYTDRIWYNILLVRTSKLLGVPEIDPLKQRPALQMAKFCIGLFNAMGVNVTLNDTDTTHRVPS